MNKFKRQIQTGKSICKTVDVTNNGAVFLLCRSGQRT